MEKLGPLRDGNSMQVSGFSIIRDGIRLGYPFLQSINSVLPMVDEFVIAVGDCSDKTRESILAINSPKIRIIDTVWDESACVGGQVMAQQTNIALSECSGQWCFYIQGDEVIHEDDRSKILHAINRFDEDKDVEGLSFQFLHFTGHYSIRNPLPYRRQVRIVRNGIGVKSVGDACGFGIGSRKLRHRPTGARVFHYGYVRPPAEMARKSAQFLHFYRGEDKQNLPSPDLDSVEPWAWDLRTCVPYTETHPAVMSEVIEKCDWSIEFKHTPWYRNKAWWQGYLRKNFRSVFRLFEQSKPSTSTPTKLGAENG